MAARRVVFSYNLGSWKSEDGTRYKRTATVYDDGSQDVQTTSTSPYSVQDRTLSRTVRSESVTQLPTGELTKPRHSGGISMTDIDKVEVVNHGRVERIWTTSYHPSGSSVTNMQERVIQAGQTVRTRREVAHDMARQPLDEEKQEREIQHKLQALARRQWELDALGLPHEDRNTMIEKGDGTR